MELSYTAGGNVKWYNQFGKIFGKLIWKVKLKTYLVIQPEAVTLMRPSEK